MTEFFWVIVITLSIPLLVYISVTIASIKVQQDRNSAVGIVIISTIILTSWFYNYTEGKRYDTRKSGCEDIRSIIFWFEWTYTHISMIEEWNSIYKKCMNE